MTPSEVVHSDLWRGKEIMKLAVLITLLLVALHLQSGTPVAADQYEDGHAAFLREDYQTALRLLRPLAAQGDASAQFTLGVMYAFGQGVPQDYAEAVKWFHLAADQGDTSARSFLGYMYENGQGLPQNYVQAYMWYDLAIAAGDNDAIEYRDVVSAKMTPEQIAEAQKLAREWKPTAP